LPGWDSSEQFARKFHKKISTGYCEKELDAIARQTGFKIRKSKLTPLMFVDTVLFKEANNAKVSLEDHCVALRQRYGLAIKKQSLDERFDEDAVNFIGELLTRHLANQITSTLDKERLHEALGHFSSVKIKDSTRFQVPESLKEHYPGSTGAASGAGVHIQFEFDILHGKVNDLNVTHALRQDATDAQQTMSSIEKGSLILRDLGYFSSNVLAHIQREQAYYITRAKPGITFDHGTSGKRIEFERVYRKMKRQKLSSMELPVRIIEENLPMRLIIEIVPDKEVQKRLGKGQKEAKKKGWTLSEEYKSRARLNLFMTNIPSEWVPTQFVRKVYQLRWQIELRFKAWKSFYDLDAVKKMQLHRFECYLYATLLLVMIHMEIGNQFFSILWKHTGKPLSFLKFHKTISQGIMILREAIMKENEKILPYLKFLYQVSYEKLLTEKRKHHRAPLENILGQTID
jgi:hypothetical protein